MNFCTPEIIDGLPTCRRCGIDFPPGIYDIAVIRRPCNPPAEADTTEPLRLWFDHGLGDAVQFTAVLRHFRHYWPGRWIDLMVRAGQERLFGDLVNAVSVGPGAVGNVPQHEYVGFKRVQFYDCYRSLVGMPSTKVEACLKQEFGLEPLPEFWDYKVEVPEDARERTKPMLPGLALLHYEGHCCRENKDLTHKQAAEVAKALHDEGYTVLLWDANCQSPLPDVGYGTPFRRLATRITPRSEIFDAGKPPDAAVLAAILEQCDLCVGIDSGPAHLATAVGTKTICIWQRHSPLHYYSPTKLAFHLWRADREGMDIHEPVDVGQEFFTNNYLARCWREGELGAAVKDCLEIWRRNERAEELRRSLS